MNDRPARILSEMLHARTSSLQPGDPIPTPISLASTYLLPGVPDTAHQYGRWSNPTWSALEHALGTLEQASVVIFPSGMAAIASVLMSLLKAGDRILLPGDGYYTTRILAEKYLAPMGVSIDLCRAVEYAERDLAGYALVLVETPSNPGLDICDLEMVCERARAAGATVVVDNTTMTPLGQRPLDLGAHVVVSADTKAISGHSDVVFGHVATRDDAVLTAVSDWRKFVGAISGPFESWLVLRSLETLDVRLERMTTSAASIAAELERHPRVQAVRYPGLESHPHHEIATRQMVTYGSVMGVTFETAANAEQFIERTDFIVASTSFGGTHTSAERRARWGDAVPEGYVRLSIGCEPAQELWAAMESALSAID